MVKENAEKPELVFVLGAGRSGTNLLTFAFDAESHDFVNLGENRYVWTKGQTRQSSDRRSADDVTPDLQRYYHHYFERRKRRIGDADCILLDKTPSNAFRIPFIAAIFPEAKFIHIVRDGRDNLLSRTRQWKAQEPNEPSSSNPMSHLRGKLRFLRSRLSTLILLLREGSLPPDRIPVVLKESLLRQVLPLLNGHPVMYGERVLGLDKLLLEEGVDAAAVVQWRESVLAAHHDGTALGQGRYLELRYERFIAEPVKQWHAVMAFLDRVPTGAGDEWLRENVKSRNSHKWLRPEESARISQVEHHLRPALEELGYSWDG